MKRILSRPVILFLATLVISSCTGWGAGNNLVSARHTRVAVVPPGFTSPFHVAIKDGAIEEAARQGWSVDVVAAAKEGDFAGQVAVIEQEIEKGVVAISVNPIDANAIVTAVKKANQADVPVFMHNLITPVSEGQVVEYIGYDQWNGAANLAAYTCKLLHDQGSIFILTGIPGFHANRRTEGFIWGLDQYCPGVKVVGQQTAEWDRTKAIDVATVALQQHPEIDVFYGNSDEMGIGACIAASKLGRKVNQDVWCVSIDGNDVTLDLITRGQMTATLGVYPDRMGATIIRQMARYLQGQQIPFILETPSIVVDISNVADYKAGSTWTEPKPGAPELDNGKPTGEK